MILGWLILHGLQHNIYDPNLALSLMTIAIVLIELVWIARSAVLLDRVDRQRQRAVDRLQTSQERLQLALQGAGQGIWDWELTPQVLTWDDRCKQIFGLPPDFPISYEWHLNALHPEDRQRVIDAAELALHEGTQFADGSNTLKYGGLGLGWSIAYQMVALHGGTITVASPGVGQGATFIVKLPIPVSIPVSLPNSLDRPPIWNLPEKS